MTVFFFCLLLERLTDRIHGEIIYHFVVLSHDHLHLAEVMATINTDISMQMLWLRISLSARQRIDWSKLAGWTYGYVFLTWTKARECMQMLYHLANPTFITDTSYCLDSKLAFLKAYSYAIAYKHLFKSFLLFFSNVLWLCHMGSSSPCLKCKENRYIEGQKDVWWQNTCWNSTFLPVSWPLALWMLVLARGCAGDPHVVRVVVLNYSTQWPCWSSVIWSFLCKLHFVPP